MINSKLSINFIASLYRSRRSLLFGWFFCLKIAFWVLKQSDYCWLHIPRSMLSSNMTSSATWTLVLASSCQECGNSFHSGNPNRKSRVKKACGVKVLYDYKATTMGEFQNHREMIHAKVFSCDVCEKNFRKDSYFKTHKDMHVCSKCGVFEKFKGTICDSCKGKKKKSLLRPIKSTKKSSLTPMKSTLGRSIWKKKATASLSKFLIKSRSFRN